MSSLHFRPLAYHRSDGFRSTPASLNSLTTVVSVLAVRTYCTYCYLLSFGLKLFPPTRVISLQSNSGHIRNSIFLCHVFISAYQTASIFLLGQMPLFGGITTWNHQSVLYLARCASQYSPRGYLRQEIG